LLAARQRRSSLLDSDTPLQIVAFLLKGKAFFLNHNRALKFSPTSKRRRFLTQDSGKPL
jgi:hypothetical protein